MYWIKSRYDNTLADLILLLHNDEDNKKYYVIIAKNKEGEVGKIEMYFDGATQRLTNIY